MILLSIYLSAKKLHFYDGKIQPKKMKFDTEVAKSLKLDIS